MAETEEDRLWWKGESYNYDDLTFREQQAVRALLKEAVPDGDWGDIDLIPAIVSVIAKRTDPGFTFEQALDLKPADLRAPAPPTKRRTTKA